MCRCVDVKIGSYAATVGIVTPEHMRGKEYDCYTMRNVLDIDACIVAELSGLWRQGIVTVGSCCGHNQRPGYVQVAPEHAERMHGLGYKPYESGREAHAFYLRGSEPELLPLVRQLNRVMDENDSLRERLRNTHFGPPFHVEVRDAAVDAARLLAEIYFDIAVSALGEEEVRRREANHARKIVAK